MQWIGLFTFYKVLKLCAVAVPLAQALRIDNPDKQNEKGENMEKGNIEAFAFYV